MAIIVLGMHRSGTSAVTSLIEAMGVHVGTPSEMIPPSDDNPKGFFERGDVLAINQAIFRHHISNWYNVARYDLQTRPIPDMLQQKMQTIIGKMKYYKSFVIKDPRFCYTLPDWLPFLPDPVIVYCVRHPTSIAHSLKLRNDMPEDEALLLWERYTTHALKNIDGLPVVACRYESLIEAPEETVLGMHRLLSSYVPGLHKPMTSPIDPHASNANPTHTHLKPEQQALYDRLLKL